VTVITRFRKSNPCPICGGGDDMPRGNGQRCSGFLSSDGRFAFCTREEHAGNAPHEDTEPLSYRHILQGGCRCGIAHSPAPTDEQTETAYDYVDEHGAPLFQVVRRPGKRFVQRRRVNGEWVYRIGDARRVLYRLPRVIAAVAAGETIYIVEGEKDVAAVERAGAVATCNPGGAGKWRPAYAKELEGANIIIVADNDAPGIEHARAIAASLNGNTTVGRRL
jgi:hypothetical protein